MDMTSGKKRDFGTEEKDALERCVLCGKLTGVSRDTPIREREYYVEAAGQLCAECFSKIYIPSHNDDILNP